MTAGHQCVGVCCSSAKVEKRAWQAWVCCTYLSLHCGGEDQGGGLTAGGTGAVRPAAAVPAAAAAPQAAPRARTPSSVGGRPRHGNITPEHH